MGNFKLPIYQMKTATLIALVAVVKADDPKPPAKKAIGTACTEGGTDFCGPTDGDDKMCCGIAAGGKVDLADGSAGTQVVPNVVICNSQPAVDYTGVVYSAGADDAKIEVKATYPLASFTCLSGAKALVASA